ncbi:DUF6286 domain-containing Asp23/Gls24 family envelope stress response protein [Streptomyces sp. NPDC050560]|uniref:DUF6286 domain-containing Asp23/Gls24 family envelope stress response protein n=1 Tax=Streptomyces sp. NPDC050560 TaxID=3365630 RepID=UPI0037ADFA19
MTATGPGPGRADPGAGGRAAAPPAQRGTTRVADRAVRRIVTRAAAEALPEPGAGPVRGAARVRGGRAEVALDVTLPYPAPLSGTVREVQRHVAERTHQLAGLPLAAPSVRVTALSPAGAAEPAGDGAGTGAAGVEGGGAVRTPRRWWAPRRVPMALLTLATAVAFGALALDMALVHAAGRGPSVWRADLVDWLSRHGPESPVAIGAGIGCTVLGLLLIVLAVTPGHRSLLPVVTGDARLSASVDRTAVALLVRDAVAQGPGVGAVAVRIGRRRAAVRVGVLFGDTAARRAAAAATAHDTLAACGLRRTPRLRLRVRQAINTSEPRRSGPAEAPATPEAPEPTGAHEAPAAPAAPEAAAPATPGPAEAPATPAAPTAPEPAEAHLPEAHQPPEPPGGEPPAPGGSTTPTEPRP